MKIEVDIKADSLAKEIRDYTTYIKRSLMSFDKLNRLVKTGSGGGKVSSSGSGNSNIDHELNMFSILFRVAETATGKAKEFAVTLLEMMAGSKSLSEEISVLPTYVAQLTRSITEALMTMLGFPPAMKETAEGVSDANKEMVQILGTMTGAPDQVESALSTMKTDLSNFPLWLTYNYARPVQKALFGAVEDLVPSSNSTLDTLMNIFSGYANGIYNVFTTMWDKLIGDVSDSGGAMDSMATGVTNAVKTAVNRVISGINSAYIDPFTSLNDAFSKLSTFKIGGVFPFKNFALSVTVPKIPMLAQGAVLPANKPFLAMVGDQKNGTNVEAPLSTIQQAVADVMEDVIEAEMAGHNATVSVLTRILEAVLGMTLNEQAIGRAAGAYALQQNIITGGY